MKKYLNFRNIALALLIVFLAMQVFSVDKANPPVNENEEFFSVEEVPQDVAIMIKSACNDCHSHHTRYPWYSNIEPVSWWLRGHIDHGRGNLNFSKWSSYTENERIHKVEECIEVLEERRMPFKSYTWMHPEARLDDASYERLIAYFQSLN